MVPMLEQNAIVKTPRRSRRRASASLSKTPGNRKDKLGNTLALMAGTVLCTLAVATPWLFGTTEEWSVRLMNWGSFAFGLCSFAAYWTRRTTVEKRDETLVRKSLATAFFASNLLVLTYCLTALLNARASFSSLDQTFIYNERVISWLPTTYDSKRTGQFLVNSAALFCVFWGTRHWLRMGHQSSEGGILHQRFKVFLWVLSINGFLLALQGTFQRLSNSSLLLWFRRSWWGVPEGCFGPYSYRGNAADYLNLIFPVTFGFWYLLVQQRKSALRRIGNGPETILLPMFLAIAAASFVTLSRGGALVAGMILFLLIPAVLTGRSSRIEKAGFIFLLVVLIVSVASLSGTDLTARFKAAFSDNLSGRSEIYKNAEHIAADFPLFGTGPGTFPSIYHLYRQSPTESRAAFLHDDWLETKVTFGWLGMSLVLLQLVLLIAWAFANRKTWASPVFTFSLFVSLAGCLIHAKADFPFQTYSIFFTFVLISATLTVEHPKPNGPLP
ncbi:MAG TPA: O-antigen ligase family protein [Verrucomicrobiae bacterium]|nr:O-antigen ligase family protein [Verrucomicrobiae bacterium]